MSHVGKEGRRWGCEVKGTDLEAGRVFSVPKTRERLENTAPAQSGAASVRMPGVQGAAGNLALGPGTSEENSS